MCSSTPKIKSIEPAPLPPPPPPPAPSAKAATVKEDANDVAKKASGRTRGRASLRIRRSGAAQSGGLNV